MMSFNKISWWKVLLSGLLYAVLAQVIHSVGAMLTMSYFMMEEYFPVWSRLMMPTAGPPPSSFYVYGIVYAFITGLLFTGVYLFFRDAISYSTASKKGLCYGLVIFIVSVIPNSLNLHLLINLPGMLIIYWALEQLVILILAGMIVAKLNR